ncbi:MAG: preprotein translocase subunit YajC [Actinomycetota bacterium]|jgi:preprotein translocase subunit YajC|nr:preprotein translocase subunit YajC [Actinomycetota bacterium]
MEALLPLIVTFGLMWALLIRPQQRRVRDHQQLVATLGAGDEVITTGGIVGTIVSVVDDIVTLEVAPGMSIRLLRSAVQSRIAADADIDEAYEADDEVYDDDDMAEFEDDVLDPELPAPPPAPPAPPAAAAPSTPTEVDAEYIPPPQPPPTTGEKA